MLDFPLGAEKREPDFEEKDVIMLYIEEVFVRRFLNECRITFTTFRNMEGPGRSHTALFQMVSLVLTIDRRVT